MRHRAWLGRSEVTAKTGSWRPQKLHRVAAKRVLTHMDSQFRAVTGLSGLRFFAPDANIGLWQDWRSWPHLLVACDLGPDQTAAMHYILYQLQLNCTMAPDPSHGAHRDMILLLKRVDLYPFWILMLISWNLPHGPFQDDLRYFQIHTAMNKAYEESSPHSNALFQEVCPMIYQELLEAGVQFPGEQSMEVETWAHLKEAAPFKKK
eukprot:9562105-Lingulodinium_polyedra.AAC.1